MRSSCVLLELRYLRYDTHYFQLLNDFCSFFVSFPRDQDIFDAKSESSELEVAHEKSREARKQAAGVLTTVQFAERMNETVRRGTIVRLVQYSANQFALSENDLTFRHGVRRLMRRPARLPRTSRVRLPIFDTDLGC